MNKNGKMKFNAYIDPGHGWLKVPMTLLKLLGIREKITEYSYVRGDYAYLEEDCDCDTFCKAMKEAGIEYEFVYHHTNRSSKIRSYARYPFTDNANPDKMKMVG